MNNELVQFQMNLKKLLYSVCLLVIQAREKITNLEVDVARLSAVEEDYKRVVESVRLLEEDLKVDLLKLQEQLEVEQNLVKKKSKP